MWHVNSALIEWADEVAGAVWLQTSSLSHDAVLQQEQVSMLHSRMTAVAPELARKTNPAKIN
jgi:hypothetical protein